jgi:sugar phosphate isomerase/epimerase
LSLSLFDIQFGLNIGPWENKELVPCLTRLTDLGYNGVEVTYNTFANYSDRITILKEIVDNVGIEIVSYKLRMDFNSLAKDSSILDQFQKIADFINKMGGRYIILEQGFQAEKDPDQEVLLSEFERAITDFSGICADAEVDLIFLPTPDGFIHNEEMMDRVVELIYPLGTRMALDVCDFMLMGVQPIDFMKSYLDAVSIVRINDMKILKGKKAWQFEMPEKTLLGQGKVDLNSIWNYLQANEYKGWVIAECPPESTLKEGIDKTTNYINKDLEVFLTNVL